MRWRQVLVPLLLLAALSPVNAETLLIAVSGVKAGEGSIRVALFDSADEFPDGEYYKGSVVPADTATVQVELADVAPGSYAVSLYQDVNGNLKIDKNFIGIPKEPYGFSGSWKSGGASFKEALIYVKAGGSEISIHMK